MSKFISFKYKKEIGLRKYFLRNNFIDKLLLFTFFNYCVINSCYDTTVQNIIFHVI